MTLSTDTLCLLLIMSAFSGVSGIINLKKYFTAKNTTNKILKTVISYPTKFSLVYAIRPL